MYGEITFYKHLGNLQNIPLKLFCLTSGHREKTMTMNGLVVSKALEVKRQEKNKIKRTTATTTQFAALCPGLRNGSGYVLYF